MRGTVHTVNQIHEFHAIARPYPPHQHRKLPLHRFVALPQLLADFFVRPALQQQVDDGALGGVSVKTGVAAADEEIGAAW